jgi:hypothetical protein
MATSDSEDFESADEDPEIQIDNTALYCAKEQREPGKPSTNESSDSRQKEDPDELLPNEIESGEIYQMSKDPPNDKTDIEVSDINNTAVKTAEDKADKSYSVLPSGGGRNMNVSNEAVIEDRIKDRQPKKCVKREQKLREPKPGGSVRKLGTKISPSILHAGLESESEKVKLDFLASEKSKKTCNQIVVDADDDEGRTVTVSPCNMEGMEQEIRKLSLEKRSECDIAPVLDKLSQSAFGKVCKSNL